MRKRGSTASTRASWKPGISSAEEWSTTFEHVADGLTEDIITALSQVSSLFVIARNSTFVYKGKPVKVQRVAEDLGGALRA